jgi:hypothetical protein
MGVQARRSGFYWARAGTALASLVVLGWFLAITGQTSFLTLGRSIFTILSWVGLVYAMVAGVHATADCISEEKREGTLGLLFLTDLRTYDVVLGKLSATSMGAAYALLAIVPMISLGLLVGGVTLNEVAQVAAILANTLFFSLSLGVFISTLSRNERQSVFAASVLVFLLTVGPFAVLFAIAGFGSFTTFRQSADGIAWVSLAYPMLMLHFRTILPFGFAGTAWPDAMLLHHLLGWAFLILSCVILPRFVHDLPRQSARAVRVDDPAAERRKRRDRSYRMKLLDKNAFLWLALRERGKPFYAGSVAWFVVLFFFGLFGWVGWSFPNLIFDMAINLLLLITLHFTFKLWLASEVCQRLVQDRSAGALELLLSTPLSVREIAQGQAFALRRIFAWPIAVLVLGEIFAAFWVFRSGLQRPGPLDRALTYGINDMVDKCSRAYKNGGRTGIAMDLATLGASAGLHAAAALSKGGYQAARQAAKQLSRELGPGLTPHHAFPLAGHPANMSQVLGSWAKPMNSAMTFFPSSGLGGYANLLTTAVPTGAQSTGYLSLAHAIRHASFYIAERIAVGGSAARLGNALSE